MSGIHVSLQDVFGLYAVIRAIDISTLPFRKIETIVEVCSLKLKDIVQLVNTETAKEAHYLQQYTLLLNQFNALKKRYTKAELHKLHSLCYSYGMQLFVMKRFIHIYALLYRKQYLRMERMRHILDELSHALDVMSDIILTQRDDDSSDELDEAFHEDLGSNSPAAPSPTNSFNCTDSNFGRKQALSSVSHRT